MKKLNIFVVGVIMTGFMAHDVSCKTETIQTSRDKIHEPIKQASSFLDDIIALAWKFKELGGKNGWCIPKNIELLKKTGEDEVHWNAHTCNHDDRFLFVGEGEEADEAILEFCKKHPEIRGCFQKNQWDQCFCHDYSNFHGETLDECAC